MKTQKRLWFGVLALGFVLIVAGLLAVPGVPTPEVVAQGGTPTPDEFNSNIFMWDGGNLMVVADGGEIEFQSGSILDLDTMLSIAVPTAQATATPGLYIDNASVADSLVVADGGSVVGIIQDDGFLNWEAGADFALPTAQATNVPGLKITNNSVAASLVIDGGEASVDELNADFAVISMPTAQATTVPGVIIDSSGLANPLEIRNAATPIAYVEQGGPVTLDTYINQPSTDQENIGLPSLISAAVTWESSGAIFTIAAGEIWVVHDVFLEVTTNFDTGVNNDATLTIGDGNDPDGFITLADAELQAADTEGTGWSAGWQGQLSANKGVYLDGAAGSQNFVYDEASEETIDIACGGTGLDAGAATVYVWYTRIQ